MLPASDSSPISLAGLRHGDRALVVSIAPGDSSLTARLASRGLVPGVEIGVVRDGDPILVAVDESRWALTRRDADHIQVDLLPRERRSLFSRLLHR